MQVSEERLGQVVTVGCSAGDLSATNALILEALAELARVTSSPEEASRAGALFATLLGLDEPGAAQVRLSVAARALDEVSVLPPDAVRQGLREAACQDPLFGMVCETIAAYRLEGRPRDDEEREAVEHALYLVVRMVTAQEEVDALEDRLAEGVRR